MTARVYVDGQAGTIGLRIQQLLGERKDLSILRIPEAHRKDPLARAEHLNACDVAILCLPDDASREAVRWIDNDAVRVIDGSTAFRVQDEWVYGLPELCEGQREAIAGAHRVSNPGCWPTGVTLLTRPLVDAGLFPADIALNVHGVSGYSGAGKAAIARWQSPEEGLVSLPYEAPYSLDRDHKHIPEMQRYGGLSVAPYFRPAVGSFERGMRVQIPLHASNVPQDSTPERIVEAYRERYAGEAFVSVSPSTTEIDASEFSFDPQACNGSNRVHLRVLAHPHGHLVLMAVLDNLGKGASGAAVQSLNLMLGLHESTGL